MHAMEGHLFEHYKLTVDPKQKPYRLDLFLSHRLAGVSRNRIQTGIRQGSVRVNDKVAKSSYKVQPHDSIRIFLPNPPRLKEIIPENIPLDIVYEDDYLLVVNKAAAMVVHPGTGNWNSTLVHALCYYFDHLPFRTGDEMRPGLVHRIDQGTSGLLVVAKQENSLNGLASQFANHTIDRIYWALVWGDLNEPKGSIALPIGRSIQDRRKMQVYADEKKGKRAITHYRVLERFGEVTLVECTLETGRTHQIRIHMQHLGHPLFGDTRYGGDKILKGKPFSKYKAFVQNCFAILPHQALHAHALGFMHPITKQHIYLEAELPPAFATVLKKWRTRTQSP